MNTTNKFLQPGRAKHLAATITAPEQAGLKFVLNAVAQNGEFKAPLDTLLTRRWSKTKEDYKGWYATQHNFKMGMLHDTAVASDTWVVSMLVKDKDGNVDATALAAAMKKLTAMCKYEHASVHVSNLLLADVPALGDLIKTTLLDEGINVYFYTDASAS
jgi:hypothetical protein